MTKEAMNVDRPAFDWKQSAVNAFQNNPDSEVARVVRDLKSLDGTHQDEELAGFVGTVLDVANPAGSPEKTLEQLDFEAIANKTEMPEDFVRAAALSMVKNKLLIRDPAAVRRYNIPT